MSKEELVTDPDEIERLLRDDEAFTESVYRDEKGVYLLSGDGVERRYITQLSMVLDEPEDEPNTTEEAGK